MVALISQAASPDSDILAIVVRNNTDQAVERITAAGTIEDSAGNLIASGSDQGLKPNHVEPGEIAFGYVYFGDLPSKLPSGVGIKIQLGSTPADDNTFENKRDLKGLRANILKSSYGRKVVGEVVNQYTDRVTGPISVFATCFDSSGRVLAIGQDFAAPDDLAPNQTAAYSIEVPSTCPTFLAAGSGYTP